MHRCVRLIGLLVGSLLLLLMAVGTRACLQRAGYNQSISAATVTTARYMLARFS
jgi:hypothetical protein